MNRLALPLLALIAGHARLAQARTWPDRPVRLIVPFPAGSATDVVSRLLAQKFAARLGQQFVVENRAGASGTSAPTSSPRPRPTATPWA